MPRTTSTISSGLIDVPIAVGVLLLAGLRVATELGFAPAGALYFRALPLEYPLLVWFLTAAALRFEMRRMSSGMRTRTTTYLWWVSVVGLAGAGAMILAFARSNVLAGASVVYWTAAACIALVFVSLSGAIQHRGIGVAANVVADVSYVAGRVSVWVCALASVWLLAAAPRGQGIPTDPASFGRWFLRQAATQLPPEWPTAPITLVEVTDYACRHCRQAAEGYADALERARNTYPGDFVHVLVDFPLDAECNPLLAESPGVGTNSVACEAAVAVRLARREGAAAEADMRAWLWEHQERLTEALITHEIGHRFGVAKDGSDYVETAGAIAREALQISELGVSRTPAYFVNGRRIPPVSPDLLEVAIAAAARTLPVGDTP